MVNGEKKKDLKHNIQLQIVYSEMLDVSLYWQSRVADAYLYANTSNTEGGES